MEDKGTTFAVCRLGLEEVYRLLAPVSSRVQVMSSVITIIEAESVTLHWVQISKSLYSHESNDLPAHQSM